MKMKTVLLLLQNEIIFSVFAGWSSWVKFREGENKKWCGLSCYLHLCFADKVMRGKFIYTSRHLSEKGIFVASAKKINGGIKGRLQKIKTSYLVTLSIIPFTPTLPRSIVTMWQSDKVVLFGPPPSLENKWHHRPKRLSFYEHFFHNFLFPGPHGAGPRY